MHVSGYQNVPNSLRRNSAGISRRDSLPGRVGKPTAVHQLLFWKDSSKAHSNWEEPLESKLARLETVLFVAREPLPTRKLSQLAGLEDGTEARTIARELNERYDLRNSAFRVEQVAGGFQLLTRPQFSPWLRRLHQADFEIRLSPPAMETLAIVAYRQPILRAEVESIRGVQCGELLRQLMEKDLVRITGKSPEIGRPFLYGTTKGFLQLFGLRDIEELPRYEELCTAIELDIPHNHESSGDDVTSDDVTSEEIDKGSSTNEDESPNDKESEVKVSLSQALPVDEEILTNGLPANASLDDDEDDFDDDLDDLEEDVDDEDDDDDDDDDEDDDEDYWEEVDDDEDEEDEDEIDEVVDEDWDEDDEDDWDEEDEDEDEDEDEVEDEDDEDDWDEEDDEDDDWDEEDEDDDEEV